MQSNARKRWVRRVFAKAALFVGAICVFGISGCGGGSTMPSIPIPATKVQFAYTTNLESGTISGYSVDSSSGALTPLAGFPIASGTSPVFMVHDPLNKFLVLADIAADLVRVYEIDPTTGMLTEVPPSPYHVGREPRSLAIDPTGRFVYVVSQMQTGVEAFSMDRNGVLTPMSGSPFSTGGNSFSIGSCVAVDRQGKFLYAEDLNNVYAFRIDTSTGALNLISTEAGPRLGDTLTLDPAGTFLYAVGSGTNSIEAYAVDPAAGTLTPSTPSPLVLQDGAYTISIAPSGQYAYTVEAGETLVGYSLKNGIFSSLGETYPGALGSQQLTIDPTGIFIYAPQTGTTNNVSGFRIGATGALSALPGSPTATGNWPFSVTLVSK